MRLLGLLLGSINCAVPGPGWADVVNDEVECTRYKLFAKAVFEAGFPAKMVLGIPPSMIMSSKVAEMTVRKGCRDMCGGQCSYKSADFFSEELCYEYDPTGSPYLPTVEPVGIAVDPVIVVDPVSVFVDEPLLVVDGPSAVAPTITPTIATTIGSYDFNPFWFMKSISDDTDMKIKDWFSSSSYDPEYYGWDYTWEHYSTEGSYSSMGKWEDMKEDFKEYDWSAWDSSDVHSWDSFKIEDLYLPKQLEKEKEEWKLMPVEDFWWKPSKKKPTKELDIFGIKPVGVQPIAIQPAIKPVAFGRKNSRSALGMPYALKDYFSNFACGTISAECQAAKNNYNNANVFEQLLLQEECIEACDEPCGFLINSVSFLLLLLAYLFSH